MSGSLFNILLGAENTSRGPFHQISVLDGLGYGPARWMRRDREDEVRRTLDYLWSDSEGAARILEKLRQGNEDLYRFEKMLEAP